MEVFIEGLSFAIFPDLGPVTSIIGGGVDFSREGGVVIHLIPKLDGIGAVEENVVNILFYSIAHFVVRINIEDNCFQVGRGGKSAMVEKTKEGFDFVGA